MFRSTDYDDAWSPYVPFDSNGSTDTTINDDLNESATCQNPMKALIEGRWKKRRHGMNLVPLKMHFRDDNASKSCEDHTALQNSIALNQGRLKWLDSQTRFLSSMLDDLYRTGIRRQIDASRTERCHRVSRGLLHSIIIHFTFLHLFSIKLSTSKDYWQIVDINSISIK